MNRVLLTIAAACVMATGIGVDAQRGRGGGPAGAPQVVAPIDLTGSWVSVVTEDWRWRMVTPPKGDYARVPLNPAGRKMADAWDPARDVAEGHQCRPFGAANIMRMPGRQRITWSDPNTLKIDYDAGTQTRLLHFDKSLKPPAEKTWQGWSVAEWEFTGGEGGRGGAARWGSLKVVTTGMRAGHLRKNGVPYSESTVMTEHFDRHGEANGNEWFTVMTIIEDPVYLTQPFILTTSFKKEPDNSKWRATPCEVAPPLK